SCRTRSYQWHHHNTLGQYFHTCRSVASLCILVHQKGYQQEKYLPLSAGRGNLQGACPSPSTPSGSRASSTESPSKFLLLPSDCFCSNHFWPDPPASNVQHFLLHHC